MTTAYTTVPVLMDALDKQVDDSNGRLTSLILRVSEAIDRICNRYPDGFVAAETATARLFSGRGGSVLRIDENIGVTALGIKANPGDSEYVDWDADTWIAFSGDPSSPNFNATPYTGLMSAAGSGLVFTGFSGGDDVAWESTRYSLSRHSHYSPALPTVQVTALWGYAEDVPGVIEEACIMQSARIWKRVRGAMADTLTSGEMGQLIYRVKLDPDVENLLKGARMVRVAVG